MTIKALFRFMDWPLRVKMAALLIVASLLPLAIATLINIREARVRLVENTAALLAARGDQLLRQIDAFHRAFQHSADRIAHLPNVLEFCQAGSEDNGRLKASVRSVLEVWPASDKKIRGVALLDMSGTVKVATEDPLIGLNLSDRRYVREALGGIGVISDIHLAESQVGYVPTIAYLAPVLGPEQKLIGVVVFWIRATALWDVMKASNELAGPNSFAVMFDQQGIRIAHTYSDEIVFHPGGRLSPALVDALVTEHRFGEKTRELLEDVRAFPEQFDRALATSPDQAMFQGFAPVNQKWNYGIARRFETVPWTVFYMIPEQSVNAQIAKMTSEITAFAGAIIVLALIAGSPFAAVILNPIESLSTATNLIASGDLAARVGTDRVDELGRLGASFNSMAERIETQAADLRKARDELEIQVQERTGELAQANESMRMSEARMRAIVESALDCVITMDHEGRIVEFNPAAEKTFGYRRGEAIGQLLAEMIIPESLRKRHAQGLSRYLSTGNAQVLGKHLEMMAVRSDGTEFPVELAITRLGSQEPPTFAGFIRDITERKRAEETAGRVRQAEEEQRVALEANRVKNEFLATMSHELRTPLNAVIGFTGTMLMELPGPITAEQKKQLETIKSSARHQLSLINDLLDLAKIDAGKVELKLEPIICNTVVDEVAETLRPFAEKKGLAFETDMPREVTINTDRRALSQILLNLINNAIKFTDAGRIRVELRDNNGSTEISVRDTGIGIECEHQAKLFGAFTRIEHRGQSHQEGTGLGLHLSQKLAALLSGQIRFESTPGKGSVFTLLLARRKG